MQPSQILCPNCRGGNAPEAMHCRWCNAPLQTQQPPYSVPQQPQTPAPEQRTTTGRTFALAIGVVLILIGLFLASCFILTTIGGSERITQEESVTGTIILVAVSTLCFVVPGVILLIVGIRKPKTL